jgi:antitoxin component of RelBE/YafQ-DinJ toxin-antitoxin module
MTTLTIRIEEALKAKAFDQAEKLGIPLTLVIKNALVEFVKNQRITIGEPETMAVTKRIQSKMDKIGNLLPKKRK